MTSRMCAVPDDPVAEVLVVECAKAARIGHQAVGDQPARSRRHQRQQQPRSALFGRLLAVEHVADGVEDVVDVADDVVARHLRSPAPPPSRAAADCIAATERPRRIGRRREHKAEFGCEVDRDRRSREAVAWRGAESRPPSSPDRAVSGSPGSPSVRERCPGHTNQSLPHRSANPRLSDGTKASSQSRIGASGSVVARSSSA